MCPSRGAFGGFGIGWLWLLTAPRLPAPRAATCLESWCIAAVGRGLVPSASLTCRRAAWLLWAGNSINGKGTGEIEAINMFVDNSVLVGDGFMILQVEMINTVTFRTMPISKVEKYSLSVKSDMNEVHDRLATGGVESFASGVTPRRCWPRTSPAVA